MTGDLEFRIAKLEAKPGDVLVFTTPRMLSQAQCAHLRAYIAEVLPGLKALIVDGGAEVSLLTREDLTKRLGAA